MRGHLDIASVNTASSFRVKYNRIKKVDISAGGVAPIPLYLERTCKILTGKIISTGTARLAAETACDEISPIDDIRGSAVYKKLLLRRLIISHFIQLFPHQIDLVDLL
jgi:xanthine dehydrogenase small subunit